MPEEGTKKIKPPEGGILFIANFVSGFYFFFIAMFPDEIYSFSVAT
jgi:hypothetical protein